MLFEKSQSSYLESSFGFILFIYFNLPVSTSQIKFGEVFGSCQKMETFLYSRNGIRIFHCLTIKSSEVNAEPDGAVFLSNYYNVGGVRALTWSNSTSLEHFRQMFSNFLKQPRRYAAMSLLERLVVMKIDFVFDQVAVSEICESSRKYPFPFNQKLFDLLTLFFSKVVFTDLNFVQ